ncbi:MAG: PEP-utilizing enzyme [Candidatus Micrarchaeota archaeon]
MAFVEKAVRAGSDYYFVTASHRLPGGGWKKLRKYFGSSAPSEAQVKAAEEELQEQAHVKGLAETEEWCVVEEFPVKPPGRARPLLIEAGMKPFSLKSFAGIPSFGKGILYHEGGKVEWLLEKGALLRAANATFRKVVEEPEWAEAVNRRVANTASAVFAYFGGFPQDFSSYSNAELAEWMEEVTRVRLGAQECGVGWLALDLAREPPLVNYLMTYLNKRKPEGAGSAFAVLTTPCKQSNAQREEEALVALAARIQGDEQAFRLFTTSKKFDPSFFDAFGASPRLYRAFCTHADSFRWLPFMYEGPAWSNEYFAQTLAGLLKDRPNLAYLRNELRVRSDLLAEKQEALLKEFGVDEKHARLLEIAREIVWGRGFRKDSLYFAFYKLHSFHAEVGRRLGLTRERANYLYPWEIPSLLKQGKKVAAHEMDARHALHVLFIEDEREQVYVGDAAREFMKTLPVEAEKAVEQVRELKGLCASPGQGRGAVCVVNSPSDLTKMRDGNILVSHATDPSLVTGMKKASAIVTDMGGIACHAAIVSRELGIPCLVGTRTATKSFKDGDLVHVDATHGVIRRISAGE